MAVTEETITVPVNPYFERDGVTLPSLETLARAFAHEFTGGTYSEFIDEYGNLVFKTDSYGPIPNVQVIVSFHVLNSAYGSIILQSPGYTVDNEDEPVLWLSFMRSPMRDDTFIYTELSENAKHKMAWIDEVQNKVLTRSYASPLTGKKGG